LHQQRLFIVPNFVATSQCIKYQNGAKQQGLGLHAIYTTCLINSKACSHAVTRLVAAAGCFVPQLHDKCMCLLADGNASWLPQ
jgi:hypothetical protein